MTTFKDGDVVRIKLEWCNDPKEHDSFYVVFNNNEEDQKCCIGWIKPKGYIGFGHSENALWEYLEHAE